MSTAALFDLMPVSSAAVNGGEPLAASADSSVQKADGSNIYPARAGDVHSAPRFPNPQQETRNPELKGSIFDDARRVLVKELMELHGEDIPCARKFKKYLETLPLSDLCARREQFFRERLPIQLELGSYMLKDGGML